MDFSPRGSNSGSTFHISEVLLRHVLMSFIKQFGIDVISAYKLSFRLMSYGNLVMTALEKKRHVMV